MFKESRIRSSGNTCTCKQDVLVTKKHLTLSHYILLSLSSIIPAAEELVKSGKGEGVGQGIPQSG